MTPLKKLLILENPAPFAKPYKIGWKKKTMNNQNNGTLPSSNRAAPYEDRMKLEEFQRDAALSLILLTLRGM